MQNIPSVIDQILGVRCQVPAQRSVLVAVSGIDSSGKGYLSARLVQALQAKGVRVAGINIDGWLNLPPWRFNPTNRSCTCSMRIIEMACQEILTYGE
jgi:uridine kinase